MQASLFRMMVMPLSAREMMPRDVGDPSEWHPASSSVGAPSGRLMPRMSPSLPRDGGDWRGAPHVVELAD